MLQWLTRSEQYARPVHGHLQQRIRQRPRPPFGHTSDFFLCESVKLRFAMPVGDDGDINWAIDICDTRAGRVERHKSQTNCGLQWRIET
ncbi:hypothetical protein Fuma_01433 [Fuerstiella marisgermanici]|uniref:Uncharacterized protein n=1 Tax=Fuerstiella marisgermanici TaxID=1891926 RepID=A0A1P8WCQ4_9PLAN|nr:hypothetical protein Fuma_01433 [Fuerstiella marisgermanici]